MQVYVKNELLRRICGQKNYGTDLIRFVEFRRSHILRWRWIFIKLGLVIFIGHIYFYNL